MRCTQCNAELPEKASFCTQCGAKVAAQAVQESNEGAQTKTVSAGGMKKPAFTKKTGMAVGCIAAVLLICIVLFVVIANRKTTLNLWEYAEVNYEGYDGYGEATIEWNTKKLYKAAIQGMKLKDKDKEDLWDAYKDSDEEEIEDILDDCDYDAEDFVDLLEKILDKTELSKEKKLSNGDKITVKFKFDNEDAKEFGLKFKAEEKEIEVKDLKKIEKINPFDYLDVTFEGVSPRVRMQTERKDECPDALNQVQFDYDSSEYYKLGDKVTIKVNTYDNEESLRSNYGCEFSETEKEYTVENVDSYTFTNKELEESDAFASMKKEAEAYLKQDFEQDKSAIKASDLKFAGYHLLTKKDQDADYYFSYGDYNILYLVYTAKIKSADSYNKFKATTVYFPVTFNDTVKKADGTFEANLDNVQVAGGISLGYHWMRGYTSEADMKNGIITSAGAKYDCVSVK